MKKSIKIGICFGVIIIFFFLAIGISFLFRKTYDNEYFHIETYQSKVDKDMDGVEDERDVLESVRSYIARKPKYKSKYYDTGYPNDQYGVCTDVVAFGLLGAGYDLMTLLNEDVLQNKEEYDIDVVDKNIDFRRVLNVDVYLKRNAISLTTDIYDISNWQGGDIVVFQKHIGIVSDKRNRKGINLLIHHSHPLQFSYEEDVLESMKGSIIGHYRIS